MTDLIRQHWDDVDEIGEKVGELVKDAKIKERFIGQIKRFCEKVEKYGQDLQAYREKQPKLLPERKKILTTIQNGGGLLNTEEEIKLIDLTHVLPSPPDGFINMCYGDYAFITDSLHFAYRPAKLENPLLWFSISGNADMQQKPKPEDELMCDYVKLAVINDNTLHGPAKGDIIELNKKQYVADDPKLRERLFSYEYKGQWFNRKEFIKQVWQHYSHTQIQQVPFDRKLQRELGKKLSELKDAFECIQDDPGTKQVQWNKDDPQFMSASEAIVTFTENKLPMPTLSKLLTPDGSIRYMRQGRRCRVHISDFREWAERKYPSDKVREEIAGRFIDDIADRKAKEDVKRTPAD